MCTPILVTLCRPTIMQCIQLVDYIHVKCAQLGMLKIFNYVNCCIKCVHVFSQSDPSNWSHDHRKKSVHYAQVVCKQPVSLPTGRVVVADSLQTRILRALKSELLLLRILGMRTKKSPVYTLHASILIV